MTDATVTFLELGIAFEILTGNTIMAQHDLAAESQIIQRAFLQYWQN